MHTVRAVRAAVHMYPYVRMVHPNTWLRFLVLFIQSALRIPPGLVVVSLGFFWGLLGGLLGPSRGPLGVNGLECCLGAVRTKTVSALELMSAVCLMVLLDVFGCLFGAF